MNLQVSIFVLIVSIVKFHQLINIVFVRHMQLSRRWLSPDAYIHGFSDDYLHALIGPDGK